MAGFAKVARAAASRKVRRAMLEMKAGTLRSGGPAGKKVTNRKQAIAIGLSEARALSRD